MGIFTKTKFWIAINLLSLIDYSLSFIIMSRLATPTPKIDEQETLLPVSERPTPSPPPLDTSPYTEEDQLHTTQYNGEINPIRPLWYILLLTVVIGGLQLSWSTEFSNGTPYLLSLGMSKSLMSLVWIAGPLSGTIGQPIVGVLSDELRWTYGRRRPFMIGGAIATIISLLTLSWSKSIVGFLTGEKDIDILNKKTIPLAVTFVYVLDFSISVIQAATRAFIVDNVPTSQQQEANAWAARLIGVGNIFGFILGAINLPKYFPSFFGDTQFKILAFCASMGLICTVTPVCLFTTEQDPNKDITVKRRTSNNRHKLLQIWTDTCYAIKNLSPQTKLSCIIEFFAWIGYFPMLFYSSMYIATLYKAEHGSTDDELAIRKGSFGLFLHAIVSVAANFLLPYLLTLPPLRIFNRTVTFTVNGLWIFGHAVFLIGTFSTFFITKATQGIVFITILGIPWAIALWAPFVIISEESSRIKSKKQLKSSIPSTEGRRQNFEDYVHESGIILGVHNMFVALPQFVSSLLASILFKIFDDSSKEGEESSDSIGWVYRFGGLATVVALYYSFQLKDRRHLDSIDNQYIN